MWRHVVPGTICPFSYKQGSGRIFTIDGRPRSTVNKTTSFETSYPYTHLYIAIAWCTFWRYLKRELIGYKCHTTFRPSIYIRASFNVISRSNLNLDPASTKQFELRLLLNDKRESDALLTVSRLLRYLDDEPIMIFMQ